MARSSVEALYDREIRPLSREDRLRLLALMEQDLLASQPEAAPSRSILELEGLGADIWHNIDAQEYVRTLRAEWDNPSDQA